MKGTYRGINSGVVIARMLHTEGFSSRTANAVRKWHRRKLASSRHRERHAKARRALSEMVKRLNLSDGDRIILGHFIQYETAANFEAGLRIGLTAQMFPEAGGVETNDGRG